jgi:YbbR domain-containing protein
LAIILAAVVWVVAVQDQNPITKGEFSDAIEIEVSAPPLAMRLWAPVEESVFVTVRAPKDSWDNLRRQSFRAFLDISSLRSGLHEVPVQIFCSDPEVEIVESAPARISVRLERTVSRNIPVSIEVQDTPPFGYYQAGNPLASPAVIQASGFETYVEQVAEAAAAVSVGGAKRTVELRKVPILRDAQGLPINTGSDPDHALELQPSSVAVTVPIEQRRGFRDVSVRVVREGQPAAGYRISNVAVEPAIVTVVGSPTIIEELPGFVDTYPVSVDAATSDVVERVGLQLPGSVSVLDTQGTLVTIAITPIESSLTIERPVEIQGIGLGLAASPSPDSVEIILSGPLPQLESLQPQDVRVILDLFDRGEGVHQIKPQVISREGLTVQSVLPENVEVVVDILPTPTRTPRVSPTPLETTLPAETTATVQATATISAGDTVRAQGTAQPTEPATPTGPAAAPQPSPTTTRTIPR